MIVPKVVMVGDPEQLQAIEAGAAFRSVTERHGAAEITEIRRQREDWQRDATRALATGRTGEAIHAYDGRGMVHAAETREAARGALVDGWDRARQAESGNSRIILTHTNAEVRELNEEARGRLRASGDLGDDVAVKTERGDRQFATGDRIMFLRNERGMGVKNGTLATIERVSAEGMAVRLDDGRGVAFDTKDYTHVDHGYAATFHKSQGVTVDRAHILATPGMDRHSAYVGMSRHRDSMQVHYGHDDFVDRGQLVRALSRDRGKDMAGDYAKPEQDQARAFADRREIRFPERARQVVEKVRDKARGMFDGFRPKAFPSKVEGLAIEKATSSERIAADRSPAPSQARAIERYGRAAADIVRMTDKGLPVLAHQKQALAKAGDVLDQTRPHAARDLASAITRDPRLARDAAEGNTRVAAKAMETERQVRIDPEKRADRFMELWQVMTDAKTNMERAGDRAGAEKLGKRMESIASRLHRDPQLESVLRRRAPELTPGRERGRSVGQELAQSIQPTRDRDRDRDMSR
ncbi:AAA family ATPase [Sphingomonas faeni]|uniref:AAA family ATPase n=1 Tax=Sphingomonas faeni TaxID=185950 RepID=UPI002780E7BF|nr:hypothetical protein [Sphingomonas faeni]